MLTTEPIRNPARARVPPLSAGASKARRRALIAIGAVGALLVLLWFSDSLAGLLPSQPYHPTTQVTGAYHVTLSLSPTQPRAGAAIAAQIALVDAQHHPITDATVTYTWEMVTMDMGVATGHANPSAATQGSYATQVTAAMGGAWRLAVHIHRANQADATMSFTVQVHS